MIIVIPLISVLLVPIISILFISLYIEIIDISYLEIKDYYLDFNDISCLDIIDNVFAYLDFIDKVLIYLDINNSFFSHLSHLDITKIMLTLIFFFSFVKAYLCYCVYVTILCLCKK